MTFIAHSSDPAQEKTIQAFLEALEVPYETGPDKDETDYLLSTESNAKRLTEAIENEQQGKGIKLSLDEIWK